MTENEFAYVVPWISLICVVGYTYSNSQEQLDPRVGFARPSNTSACIAREVVQNMSSRHMVTMETGGRRLGNHIFVYASLLGIAKRENMVPILHETFNVFMFFKAETVQRSPKVETSLHEYLKVVEDKAYVYDRSMEYLHDVHVDIKLVGYFLSWKYFRDIVGLLREELTFNKFIITRAKRHMEGILATSKIRYRRIVGVHVRRGDINSPYLRMKGFVLPTSEYFRKAMKYFTRKYHDVLFIVCSDDLDWSRQNIYGEHVAFVKDNPPEIDLALLSLSDDVIMSLGTFGWWAGWLAGGEVIYFKDWFLPESYMHDIQNGVDHFPPSWIPM